MITTWLVITQICALVQTYVWASSSSKNRFGLLAAAFQALTFMIFVDHVLGWALEGASGEFLDISAEAFVLSLCMVIPIFALWELLLVLDKFGLRKKRKDTETASITARE